MFAIVGSGFGLYGYLPAVAQASGEQVLLPEAYREKVLARPELAPWLASIRWMPDEQAALEAATGLVVATPPARQEATVRAALLLPRIERFVLEKPLARDPVTAALLLDEVDSRGRRYRVGYTFLHTAWASGLEWPRAGEAASVSIEWTFMAHHYALGLRNWKREHAGGGGALRFFGVHVFALLARAGYDSVRRSVLLEREPGEPERWEASFAGPGRPDCRLVVDSRSDATVFRIDAGGKRLVDLTDPYSLEPRDGEQDRRVGVLGRLLASFAADDAAHRELCRTVNGLWRAAEEAAAR